MDMVVGETFAHIGYALAPKAEEYKMPTIFPVIAADDLTQRKPKSKWVVRLGWTGSQPSHPFGEYAAKTLGYKPRRGARHRLRVRLRGHRRFPAQLRGGGRAG